MPVFRRGLAWVQSEGGPLLLLPERHLTQWEGVRPPSGGRVVEAVFRWGDPSAPATDYDRAADVDDWVAVLPVGQGEGLVLNDFPAMTAWWPELPGERGLLVRWLVAESEADVIRHLARVPEEIWSDDRVALVTDNERLYLFDSALAGREVMSEGDAESLVICLRPGRFSVLTAHYMPDERTRLMLHRLSPEPV